MVAGSEAHVERAVTNVLKNAIEAVGDGGHVHVILSAVELRQTFSARESVPPGSYAVISVSDSGPGIDDASQRRIFEPFFSTKRLGESSGSGLGLAIVYGIVKEHQGYVDVSSQIGKGARFTLYFPRLDVVAAARSSVPPVTGDSARILVVDDDLTQLRTAKRVLTRCGYDVTTMASGARAYELMAMEAERRDRPEGVAAEQPRSYERSSYDLLIVDLALNEPLDGLQFFKKVRQLFPRQRGILASGHAFVDHEDEIRAANLVWLPKPYTMESLTTAIRTALRDS
jgi:CheY-like chemotaxis protein